MSTRLLFSTFEQSGDALAAEVISSLRRADPQLTVYALGGPRMQAAGAHLLETTTQRGSMFFETVAQAWSHHKRLGRLRQWLHKNKIDALVPVDSPAGNWSICHAVRQEQPSARIIHLVAPQLWAWGPWRVRRLRRLTDRVLCLLPFEPSWFAQRRVPAVFVGHPAFESSPVEADPGLPSPHPRLALLPGSRTAEIKRNWPTMLDAFRALQQEHQGLCGAAASPDRRTEDLLLEIARRHRGLPGRLVMSRSDAVLDWCDVALVCSGTITLQAAARNRPMVVLYNMSPLTILLVWWTITTRTYALPNLVSEQAGLGRAVPELIPHFGRVKPVVTGLQELLTNENAVREQKTRLAEVVARFRDRRFSESAYREILATLQGPG